MMHHFLFSLSSLMYGVCVFFYNLWCMRPFFHPTILCSIPTMLCCLIKCQLDLILICFMESLCRFDWNKRAVACNEFLQCIVTFHSDLFASADGTALLIRHSTVPYILPYFQDSMFWRALSVKLTINRAKPLVWLTTLNQSLYLPGHPSILPSSSVMTHQFSLQLLPCNHSIQHINTPFSTNKLSETGIKSASGIYHSWFVQTCHLREEDGKSVCQMSFVS